MEQSQTVESKKVNYDDVLTFSVRLTPEEWKALLPPHVDPKDYAAAEKYIRNLLQSIVDSTPPMPRPQEAGNNARPAIQLESKIGRHTARMTAGGGSDIGFFFNFC